MVRGARGAHDIADDVEHGLFGCSGGGAGRWGGLDRVPYAASRRIRAPHHREVVDELVEEVRPLQGWDLLGETLDFRDRGGGVVAVEFADHHVLVGKVLVDGSDGYFGAFGYFVEGE